ncbi:MAG TPA: flavin reductase family protein [Chitinophagaceae bacterium]|nr:flavin reductase family protein [Chitinophagaceae bacterium]
MSLRKKPWNRISQPVYSVCSQDPRHGFNMNICTYVTAVSLHPKRFIVAVYEGTRTLENLQQDPHFVLQLLAEDQYPLVRLLGKQSGRFVSKPARLGNRHPLCTWNGFSCLAQSLALIELRALAQWPGGDHRLFFCEVLAYRNLRDGRELQTGDLRARGIITA